VILDDDVIQEIKSRPLGNHHLIMAGDHSEKLGLVKEILNIE
jgi:hypothetical protein